MGERYVCRIMIYLDVIIKVDNRHSPDLVFLGFDKGWIFVFVLNKSVKGFLELAVKVNFILYVGFVEYGNEAFEKSSSKVVKVFCIFWIGRADRNDMSHAVRFQQNCWQPVTQRTKAYLFHT